MSLRGLPGRSMWWCGALVAGCTLLAVALTATGCGRSAAEPRPLLVFGVDGAEWRAIEALWAEGRLPTLRRISERGSRAPLETFAGSSPIIWTTVATGLGPADHGVTDFVVATPEGDRPLTSGVRRAPALWNMVSDAGRDVAIFGYWATWPAEQVRGLLVSDRVRERELKDRVWPAERTAWLDGVADRAIERNLFTGMRPGVPAEERDIAVAAAALATASERPLPALFLVYFRSVDVVSHAEWGQFLRRSSGEVDEVTRLYEAVDAAIGRILEEAGGLERVNVLVVSDHGFKAAPIERVLPRLDFDRVLERLGFLVRDPATGQVRAEGSRAMTLESPRHRPGKSIRFLPAQRGEGAAPGRDTLARELEVALAGVRWASGGPVFRWRGPTAREERLGADAVAEVIAAEAELPLSIAGEPWMDSGVAVDRVSGRHDARTPGVLLAAGPDMTRGAFAAGAPAPSVEAVGPTILFGLGLPYGRDFVSRPLAGLFSREFAARHPPRSVASWGRRDPQGTKSSAADERLLEELRALGYID